MALYGYMKGTDLWPTITNTTSSQDWKLYINPNGGSVTIGYTKNFITYSQAFTLYAPALSVNHSGDPGQIELYINTPTRSGYYFTGWTVDTSYTSPTAITSYTQSETRLAIFSYTTHSRCFAIKANWQTAAPTYTACTAPGVVKLNNTAGGITVTAGTNVTLSWSGAAGGTNNPITGYWINYYLDNVYNNSKSFWVASSSTSGSATISTSGMGGHTIGLAITTCGKADGYNSSASTRRTITVNTAQVQRTITLYLNEGDTTAYATRTGYYGSEVSLPTPTKRGYMFKGWYTKHTSTKGTVVNYGDSYAYPKSVSTSFSTYMSDYSITPSGSSFITGVTPNTTAIFSMTEGSGYSFEIDSTGKTIGFYTQTKSGGYDSVTMNTADITPGWHDWNCIFNGTAKKLYLYMDGNLVGTADTSWDHINWVADFGTDTTATQNLLIAAEYTPDTTDQIGWCNFTGKIANFFITESTGIQNVNYNRTIMPDKNISMYPRWEKIVYIYNNNEWVPAKPYIYKNSTRGWTPADPYVHNGSGWK